MRLGPFRLTRYRATRALAGLVVMFLFAGNVLAAAGLCAVKAPAPGGATAGLVAGQEAPDASGCASHHAETDAPAPAAHHCPTDDPSAQSRTVDVPAAQVMLAIPASLLPWSDAELRSTPLLVAEHPAESRPLYTRLQRLHL
jgi:hypothetical protein